MVSLVGAKVQSIFMPAIITLDPEAPKGQLMFVMTLNCVDVAVAVADAVSVAVAVAVGTSTSNMQQHCGRLPAICVGILSRTAASISFTFSDFLFYFLLLPKIAFLGHKQ